MNIVFTGVTGVRKADVMKALIARRAHALQAERAYLGIEDPSLDDPTVRRVVRLGDVDDHYGQKGEAVDIEAVLTGGEITQIRRDWKQALERTLDDLNGSSEVLERYLALHATYFWQGRPAIPVDLKSLAEFQPHVFVSLIDDCYSVWWRVRRRDEKAKRGSYLRLQDILRWRQFDLWNVQQLVNNLSSYLRPGGPDIPHYVVAVKHPVEALHRILYEPMRLRVYGAHPISSVRDKEPCVSEIEEKYKAPLRDKFTLLEPGTIDEKPLEFAFRRDFPQKKIDYEKLQTAEVSLRADARLPYKEPMVPDDPEMFREGTLRLNAAEVFQAAVLRDREAKSEIDKQILERDFWLIRMSHRVTAYRPYWKDHCPQGAQGVIVELNMGARLNKSPRYVRYGEDEPAGDASPLDAPIVSVGSTPELVEALEEDQERMRQQLGGVGNGGP